MRLQRTNDHWDWWQPMQRLGLKVHPKRLTNCQAHPLRAWEDPNQLIEPRRERTKFLLSLAQHPIKSLVMPTGPARLET